MKQETYSPRQSSRHATPQLSRVPRLIRLITEVKTNPDQTPAQLCQTLGISRSGFFQDKTLLEQ
ncbi:MAG: hypothetical protein D6736_12095, partial [Nitrospinota bacterium]